MEKRAGANGSHYALSDSKLSNFRPCGNAHDLAPKAKEKYVEYFIKGASGATDEIMERALRILYDYEGRDLEAGSILTRAAKCGRLEFFVGELEKAYQRHLKDVLPVARKLDCIPQVRRLNCNFRTFDRLLKYWES